MKKGRYYIIMENINPDIIKQSDAVGCIVECLDVDRNYDTYICRLIDGGEREVTREHWEFSEIYNLYKELTIKEVRKIKLEKLNSI